MDEPLVSVLVPLYNHSKFIETCLDSVRAEEYQNLELIVLDDGSLDDSLEKAQNWIQHYERRFRRTKIWTQSNAGICTTFNRLIAETEGEFVTIVASDDILISGGIGARIRYLDEHPECLAVFGDAEVINDIGQILFASAIEDEFRASKRALCNPALITRELLLHWCVPGPVLLARRRTWDEIHGVGPYREDLVVEDRDFYLKLLAHHAVGFMDRCVAQYRLHTENASRHTLRDDVIRDIHRSHIDNMQNFHGMDRRILRLLVLEGEKNSAVSRWKRWLARRMLRLLNKIY